MTGDAVFGSNHFKDLTPQEFQSKYLTGYTGPHTDKMPTQHKRKVRRSDQLKAAEDILKTSAATKRRVEPIEMLSSNGLHDPSVLSEKISRHESVQERYLKHMEEVPRLSKTYYNYSEKQAERKCKCGSNWGYYDSSSSSSSSTNDYGSRLLKQSVATPKLGKTYYNKKERQSLCGYSTTYYNKNSNSNSDTVDCSKYKLEASVTSEVYETSSESCLWYDVSCLLRNIFTPLYATVGEKYYSNYNYPSSIDWRKLGAVTSVHSQGSCGACWAITAVETIESVNYISTGTLKDLTESEIIICDTSCEMCDGGWPQNAYQYVIDNGGLPKETGYDGDFLMTMTSVKSGESDELTESEMESVYESVCPAQESGDTSNTGSSGARYGAIDAYAYATDRCICYTDGSGCDCEEQNENLAVMNMASFGPATVCLEASTWQDYSKGIITADSGCTSAFLDMNHCVQAVGYAFQEVESDGDNDGSHSGDQNSNTQLEGYWIIRNQWSQYWGMNGYAYVAMGSNTCGVLNDMTQVFMD